MVDGVGELFRLSYSCLKYGVYFVVIANVADRTGRCGAGRRVMVSDSRIAVKL